MPVKVFESPCMGKANAKKIANLLGNLIFKGRLYEKTNFFSSSVFVYELLC